MDNLSSHKSHLFFNTIKNKGITIIFTSSSSPEFNPIELIFNTIKEKIKKKNYNEKYIIDIN